MFDVMSNSPFVLLLSKGELKERNYQFTYVLLFHVPLVLCLWFVAFQILNSSQNTSEQNSLD